MSVTDPAAAPISATITAFRDAAERGDADAVAALLAPDVAVHSPLTDRVRFEGRDEVAALHRDIFAVLHDLRTRDPLPLGDTCAAPFSAWVRGVEMRAVILVRLDDQDRIADLEIYGRPLPALAALFTALPPRVSARRRGRAKGALLAVLARPLALALHAADRMAPRFL